MLSMVLRLLVLLVILVGDCVRGVDDVTHVGIVVGCGVGESGHCVCGIIGVACDVVYHVVDVAASVDSGVMGVGIGSACYVMLRGVVVGVAADVVAPATGVGCSDIVEVVCVVEYG